MRKLVSCVCVLLLMIALVETRLRGACCLNYQRRRIPDTFLISYRVQEDTKRCNLRAIIFKMTNGKVFCADPDERWVKRRMASVDKRKPRKTSRKTN